MKNADMSNRRIAPNFGVSNFVISRLVTKHRPTVSVEDRQRSDRSRKTTSREDRFPARQARLHPISTAGQLGRMWPTGGRISDRTLIRRFHSSRLHARRPLKRLELTRKTDFDAVFYLLGDMPTCSKNVWKYLVKRKIDVF